MNITFFRVSILVSFLFLIKPLEFLATNILEVNFLSDLVTPLFFSLVLLLITLFLASFFNQLVKEKRIIFLLTFCGFFFYFQFYWLQISSFFEYILGSQMLFTYKTISLFIILSASGFLAYLCFKKNFFRFPFVVCFLVVCSQIVLISIGLKEYLNNDTDNFMLGTNAVQEEQNKISISSSDGNVTYNNNVYYLVLDGLSSLRFIKKQVEVNSDQYDDFVQKLIENGYFHISKSNSSYNITHLTFASIFNLDYFDKDLTYENRFSFFPHFLYKEGNSPNLIKELESLNYHFFYSGNAQWANCNKRKIVHGKCLNKPSENKFYSLLMNDGFITFIRNSLLIPLESQLKKIFNIKSFQPFDGMENFLGANKGNLDPNSSSFYLIHNLSPHPPYLDSSCRIDSLANWSEDKKDWVSLPAYFQSVKCVLNDLTVLLDIINEQDPSAIVVVQGDHGTSLNYDWKVDPLLIERSAIQDRFSIFNAIKIPQHCEQPKSLELGNVETIQLVMACLKKEKVKIPKNLSYAGSYAVSGGIFGQFIEVTDLLD